MNLKRVAKRIALSTGVRRVVERGSADYAPIFLMHRFDSATTAGTSLLYGQHSISALRKNLGYLRRHKFNVLPLDALIRDMAEERQALRGPVAFTVDDGYADFYELALPVFLEFDCPVTVFVTTGPLDGDCWLWWDKLEVALRSTDRRSLDLIVDGTLWQFRWRDVRELHATFDELSTRLKRVSADVQDRAVQDAASALGVELPRAAPAEHAPMTWDDVRACERTGLVQIGPHTVTHPILSTESDRRALDELATSWARLQCECAAPVPIFAYPNGTPDAYGLRDIRIVQSLKLTAAVTTEPRYLSHHDLDEPAFPLARFAIPRVSYTDDHDDFRQTIHGVEHLKWRLRGRRWYGHIGAWRAAGAETAASGPPGLR